VVVCIWGDKVNKGIYGMGWDGNGKMGMGMGKPGGEEKGDLGGQEPGGGENLGGGKGETGGRKPKGGKRKTREKKDKRRKEKRRRDEENLRGKKEKGGNPKGEGGNLGRKPRGKGETWGTLCRETRVGKKLEREIGKRKR
jgi:hypothetical protein